MGEKKSGYENFFDDVWKIMKDNGIDSVTSLEKALKNKDKAYYQVSIDFNLIDLNNGLSTSDMFTCDGFHLSLREMIILLINPKSASHPNARTTNQMLIRLEDTFFKAITINDKDGNILFHWEKKEEKKMERSYYACLETKDGKITRMRFEDRDEARAYISAHRDDKDVIRSWTE